ncbi:hypothetical protein RHGRI_028941 [Rhododendron griersonianum]|uniref:Transmembrane protein n=1 Tax=Rhododendron griersonianum TaxID=479676 RepID=A0AAV6IL15_9ERIC|nr:hypothetical protein RHGRI_028941 [Rhododendron griersonianum]
MIRRFPSDPSVVLLAVGSTVGGTGGGLICGNWWWWSDLRQLVVVALDGDYCGVTVVVFWFRQG